MIASRSVLVTGGNGFVGRHLVRRLMSDGHGVTLLQRSPEHPAGADLLPLDELGAGTIGEALLGRRFEWVFHLASYGVRPADRDIESMFRVNTDTTRRLVEIASEWSPRAIVLAGTGAEYMTNDVDRPLREDHPLECFKLYGASKAAGTIAATALARARGTPLVVARIFGVYGPGEASHRLLPTLINGLQSARRVPLTLGQQKRDFLFVDDLVEALIMLAETLERKPVQLIANVGTGKPIPVRTFAEAVAAALGVATDLLGFGDVDMRPDEMMVFSGDPSLVSTFAGWRARTEFARGIEASIPRIVREGRPA